MNRSFGRKACDLGVDLFRDRKRCACSKITASSLAAENAAFFSKGAVTVRAGHASVQGYPVDLLTVPFPEHVVQGMIRFIVPAFHHA